MFLGLPDPNPIVRCMDPDPAPDPDPDLLSASKNCKENLVCYRYCLVTFLDFLSLKNDVNVQVISRKFKKHSFCWHLKGQ